MELTAENIEEFIAILQRDSALRKRVVNALLDEDFARIEASADRAFESIRLLTEEVRQLGEEVRAFRETTEARLAEHDLRFDRVDAHLGDHDARFDRADAHLADHDARFDRIDARLDHMNGRLGNVEGRQFEMQYQDRIKSRLGRIYRRVRPGDPADLPGLDEALADGRIPPDAWEDVLRIDACAIADQRNGDERDIVVLVELSLTVDLDDVRRVYRRAEALRGAGMRVDAVVDGETILEDAAMEAERLGVTVLAPGSSPGVHSAPEPARSRSLRRAALVT